MDERLLGIYLNDQLALGIGWRELARRAQRENRGTDLGDALAEVADAIAGDVATFESIMRRVGVTPSPVKPWLAIAGERLSRLKTNGRLLEYSPLSRFLELDVLAMGIDGKVTLWSNLHDIAGLGARLPDVDFDELIERARSQRAAIEPFRRAAGGLAFGRPAVEG